MKGNDTDIEIIDFKYDNTDYYKPPCKPISSIKITENALKMLFSMAKQMKHVFGKDYEVYAFLVGNDDIVTDILIPPQTVSYTHISISPNDLMQLVEPIEKYNLKILGWGHSHCDFSVFFSNTDDENQMRILNETENYKEFTTDDGHIIKMKFAYGVTVNINGEVYGEVTTQFPCGAVFNRENVPIEVIKSERKINEKLLDVVIKHDLKHFVRVGMFKKYAKRRTYTRDLAPEYSPNITETPSKTKTPYNLIDDFLKSYTDSTEEAKYVKSMLTSFLKFLSEYGIGLN